ncbi:hypothetical protein [Thiocystis violascens]|uniref:hypothetical protein n=1 Tax=Thiocystis violascens TaxID=73141 RepID=UPI00022C2D66|nr:hypothetical protein [Thiocystis violascens]
MSLGRRGVFLKQPEQLDLRVLVEAYRGTGSQPYPPAMLVALLFYGYATGLIAAANWRKRPMT